MIVIKNLSYRYNRKKLLFDGLDLTLQPSGIYGLLGKNGAGKSTLMKTISGLLFPTEGICKVNGLEPRKREVAFLEQLFFIPEECDLPKLSIKRFTSIYAPFYPSFSQQQFSEYLSEFNIPVDAYLHQLSFGQRKKAFIAFGLATNTRLLIMDEPTNGLDIPSKVQFRKLMSQASGTNRVILLSSHQVRDLDDLISSVIIMDNSRILLHEEKARIGEQLGFYNRQQATMPGEVLYEEQTPNGWVAMCRNPNKKRSYIDLEILFNATLTNPGLIRSVFQTPIL
jgi:ABC-2 type transport system ATP-binding protein